MEASKVTLSAAEEQLIANANIILTKNEAINKIVEMFGLLGNSFKNNCEAIGLIHPDIFQVHPKVSKGEKHKELPWVMLDYPRIFSNEKGHLAIRCFFWWGNFFSIQLQASGEYFEPVLAAAIKNPDTKSWMSGITTDAWDFNLPNPHWKSIDEKLENREKCVFKMAKKIPIEEWESVTSRFFEDHTWLTSLLQSALGA